MYLTKMYYLTKNNNVPNVSNAMNNFFLTLGEVFGQCVKNNKFNLVKVILFSSSTLDILKEVLQDEILKYNKKKYIRISLPKKY